MADLCAIVIKAIHECVIETQSEPRRLTLHISVFRELQRQAFPGRMMQLDERMVSFDGIPVEESNAGAPAYLTTERGDIRVIALPL